MDTRMTRQADAANRRGKGLRDQFGAQFGESLRTPFGELVLHGAPGISPSAYIDAMAKAVPASQALDSYDLFSHAALMEPGFGPCVSGLRSAFRAMSGHHCACDGAIILLEAAFKQGRIAINSQ